MNTAPHRTTGRPQPGAKPRRLPYLYLLTLLAIPGTANCAQTQTPEAEAPMLHVKADRQPLPALLEQLAQAQHFNLHYSTTLAGRQVTADCSALQLQELLSCLLGDSQNLILHNPENGEPLEAWLIAKGETGAKGTANAKFANANGSGKNEEDENAQENQRVEREMQRTWLNNLTHGKTGDKVAAMRMLLGRNLEDPKLANQLLQEAMQDQDPAVRSKAVSTLSKLDNENAQTYLAQMLNDPDPSVRMAVVRAADTYPDVLQAALNDANEQVRSYAQAGLERLAPTSRQ